MLKRLLVCVLVISLVVLFHVPAAAQSTEEDYLRAAIDPALFEYTDIEAPTLDNVRIVKASDGQPALELRLYPGQPLTNNGIRTEVSIDYPFVEGETVIYEWQVRLVSPFPADELKRWWVMGQWHDQPDRTRGETWDGFPVNSPPILFGFGEQEGKPAFGVFYGMPHVMIDSFEVQPDTWVRIQARITWSRSSKGAARVEIDGLKQSAKPVVISGKGANMLNGFQHYFKIGMYRHREIMLENRMQIRGVKIWTVD